MAIATSTYIREMSWKAASLPAYEALHRELLGNPGVLALSTPAQTQSSLPNVPRLSVSELGHDKQSQALSGGAQGSSASLTSMKRAASGLLSSAIGYTSFPFLKAGAKRRSNLNIGDSNKAGLPKVTLQRDVSVWHLEQHPSLPYYVSGGMAGEVLLWEYSHPRPLATFRAHRKSTTRINRVHFNRTGTKMGACDNDGYLSLWNFGPGAPLKPGAFSTRASSQYQAPYVSMQCHTKSIMDFAFLGEGCVMATVGRSAGKGYFNGTPNSRMSSLAQDSGVGIWDFLLPNHQALVAKLRFPHDDEGASSIVYSPKHALLMAGNKRGQISIFDIRTFRTLQTIDAHDKNVRSLSLHGTERLLVSGSSDGDIKVEPNIYTWPLSSDFFVSYRNRNFINNVKTIALSCSTRLCFCCCCIFSCSSCW